MGQKKQALKGILYMTLAIFVLSSMDIFIKMLSKEYTPFQIMFFRSIFAFIPLSFFVLRNIQALKTKSVHLHIGRSVIGLFAMSAFIYAVARIPLAELYAIEFAAPIFMTLLSFFLLKENVTKHHWGAIAAGFLGVMIVIRPGGTTFEMASLVALIGSFLFALMAIQIRQLSKTQSPEAIVFYYTLGCTLISGLIVLFEWRTPDFHELCILIMVGLLGGTGQILITKGVSAAPVSLIAPLEYTGIIWASFFGYTLFGEIPDNMIYIGALIVIGSGLYMTYYSQKDH